MPRRRAGALLDLEAAILVAGIAADDSFHGFAIAEAIGDGKRLVGHGTLYKALARLASGGLLEAEWEDPDVAAVAGRPRRRLYTVTPDGRQALAAHHAAQTSRTPIALHSPEAGLA